MTNSIALALALAIGGMVVADLAMGWGGTLFAARWFIAMLENLAFWR